MLGYTFLTQPTTSKDIAIGTRDWFFDSINDEDFDYEKVIKLAKDLKSPKQIAPTLKKEGEVVIMKGSEPYKNGEIDRVLTSASEKYMKDGKLKPKIIEELYDEEDDIYYVHKIITKNGKLKMHKRKSKDETIFD